METTVSSTISNLGENYGSPTVIVIVCISLFFILSSFIICFYGILYSNGNTENLSCFGTNMLRVYRYINPNLNPTNRVYDYSDIWENINNDPRYQISPSFAQAYGINSRILVHHYKIPNDDLDLECPICYENIGDIKCHIGCNHYFHETCIKTWIIDQNKVTCPICRNNVTISVV